MQKNKNIIKTLSFLIVFSAILFYYQVGCAPCIPKEEKVPEQIQSVKVPKADKESVAVSQVAASILTKLHYQKRGITEETSIKFFHEYLILSIRPDILTKYRL